MIRPIDCKKELHTSLASMYFPFLCFNIGPDHLEIIEFGYI